MTDPVLLTRAGAVARLTLNRPEAGNAIDPAMARALREAAIVCAEDLAIRCVVLGAGGRMFCAGGDIGAFSSQLENLGALTRALTADLHAAMAIFARMEKPLITAVNGPAAGAGFSLALAGDLVLAGQSAVFAPAYGGIGLSPDGGASWLLPRLVGLRRAQEMLLLGLRLNAEQALAEGMITRLYPDETLQAEADEMAARVAGGAVRAWGRTRALLLESFAATLPAQLDAEARAIAQSGNDAEAREGIAAFLARRKPDFPAGG
ncbi:enoyl-CoA hydratase/isomerase family protein [Acidocella sp.]|uniref:enoyl-CoA hydratase/isomerase family protein n=1 Tax=Acidocella sp. TaxID=50710 RepID=UPI0017F12AB5|nr:enoyl-CoA hydratase-related protein [Acidocella sp.]NNM58139.1 enoyl-CoA hydratase [Acidocella sp.]